MWTERPHPLAQTGHEARAAARTAYFAPVCRTNRALGPAQWFDKPAGAWAGKLTILSPSKDCPSSHPNHIVGGAQTGLGRGLAGAGPNPEAFGGHFLIEMDTLRE